MSNDVYDTLDRAVLRAALEIADAVAPVDDKEMWIDSSDPGSIQENWTTIAELGYSNALSAAQQAIRKAYTSELENNGLSLDRSPNGNRLAPHPNTPAAEIFNDTVSSDQVLDTAKDAAIVTPLMAEQAIKERVLAAGHADAWER